MALSDREVRSATFGLEIRNPEQAVQERILTTLLVPYGETSMDTPYPKGERFMPRAFRKAAQEFSNRRRPLLLFRAHQHERAVGRAVSLKDTQEGPVAEFRLAQTPAGDEVIQEVTEGLLGGVSVGFRSVVDRTSREDGAREVLSADLVEVSVLPLGAYEGAKVLALREPQDPAPDLSWLTLPPAPAVDLSQGVRILR